MFPNVPNEFHFFMSSQLHSAQLMLNVFLSRRQCVQCSDCNLAHVCPFQTTTFTIIGSPIHYILYVLTVYAVYFQLPKSH